MTTQGCDSCFQGLQFAASQHVTVSARSESGTERGGSGGGEEEKEEVDIHTDGVGCGVVDALSPSGKSLTCSSRGTKFKTGEGVWVGWRRNTNKIDVNFKAALSTPDRHTPTPLWARASAVCVGTGVRGCNCVIV